MVKIHGNWCGPNWTAGKNQSAADYAARGGNFRSKCIDKIDCACRTHDRECSGSRGCSRSADTKLILACDRFLANPLNALFSPITYAKARVIREGIAAARPFRRH